MIYMITDSGVRSARNFHEFNNKYHVLLEEAECTPLGPDLVVTTTDQDLEFLFGNFFRKDNSVKIFAIINIILSVLIIFTK